MGAVSQTLPAVSMGHLPPRIDIPPWPTRSETYPSDGPRSLLPGPQPPVPPPSVSPHAADTVDVLPTYSPHWHSWTFMPMASYCKHLEFSVSECSLTAGACPQEQPSTNKKRELVDKYLSSSSPIMNSLKVCSTQSSPPGLTSSYPQA